MSVSQLRVPVVAVHVAAAGEQIAMAAAVPVGSLERDELSVALSELATVTALPFHPIRPVAVGGDNVGSCLHPP